MAAMTCSGTNMSCPKIPVPTLVLWDHHWGYDQDRRQMGPNPEPRSQNVSSNKCYDIPFIILVWWYNIHYHDKEHAWAHAQSYVHGWTATQYAFWLICCVVSRQQRVKRYHLSCQLRRHIDVPGDVISRAKQCRHRRVQSGTRVRCVCTEIYQSQGALRPRVGGLTLQDREIMTRIM